MYEYICFPGTERDSRISRISGRWFFLSTQEYNLLFVFDDPMQCYNRVSKKCTPLAVVNKRMFNHDLLRTAVTRGGLTCLQFNAVSVAYSLFIHHKGKQNTN